MRVLIVITCRDLPGSTGRDLREVVQFGAENYVAPLNKRI
jgi:hypothetical protein